MDKDRIETRGEDGRRVLVLKVRSRIDTSDLDGPSSVDGPARFFLANGNVVNFDGKHFEVVATGETLIPV